MANAHTIGAQITFRNQFGDNEEIPVVVVKVGRRMPSGFAAGNVVAVTGQAADGRLWWTACDENGRNQKGQTPFAQRIRTEAETGRVRN